MDVSPPPAQATEAIVVGNTATPTSPTGSHKRHPSGGGGGSLLSKFPFMRSTPDHKTRHDGEDNTPFQRPSASIIQQQQQKTRRRRGSLRKVALLGRGAQRREARSLSIDTKQAAQFGAGDAADPILTPGSMDESYGLGISDITPRPSMDGYASRSASAQPTHPAPDAPAMRPAAKVDEPMPTSPTISYSTTDDEDVLHIQPSNPSPLRPPDLGSLSSGSESYFSNRDDPIQRRRSVQRAKSPLSLSGLSSTPLPPPDSDWDYSETEWWGWVVLIVTWFVFVIGMGSVFEVWSWAWDVGTTPYAPPELEDDPTLPIVGYYPALIILTCVMAWVWVVVAWIGMKYFRHAKISGD
ncbi:hypothetical protein NKR23_g10019 [Pleurostoma richardsiae]|uniref:Uncharacterized protein n=1 Tax=Pleurostoma richardsiae TaxID=41990 RepID=A0AA38VJ79_9PEZI|nr:hypothetical protein NKR23_g10019 [Pleurostoma richardsiae]